MEDCNTNTPNVGHVSRISDCLHFLLSSTALAAGDGNPVRLRFVACHPLMPPLAGCVAVLGREIAAAAASGSGTRESPTGTP